MAAKATTVPTIKDHPEWPIIQVLIDREKEVAKAAAPVLGVLVSGAPVPSGNLELLRDALVNAGYLYEYEDGSVSPTDAACF
jgi:hypothetical protein